MLGTGSNGAEVLISTLEFNGSVVCREHSFSVKQFSCVCVSQITNRILKKGRNAAGLQTDSLIQTRPEQRRGGLKTSLKSEIHAEQHSSGEASFQSLQHVCERPMMTQQ